MSIPGTLFICQSVWPSNDVISLRPSAGSKVRQSPFLLNLAPALGKSSLLSNEIIIFPVYFPYHPLAAHKSVPDANVIPREGVKYFLKRPCHVLSWCIGFFQFISYMSQIVTVFDKK